MTCAMSRVWAMPNGDTFQIPPIGALIDKWTADLFSVADPFARTSRRSRWSNDLDPSFGHVFSMEATEFCAELAARRVQLDGVLFDPPYSPRQISELYRRIGLKVGMEETQSARLYSSVRDGLTPLMKVGAVAISFGWNSVGFGKGRGFEQWEILLVCHGGAHNDTICVVEEKVRNVAEQIEAPL